MSIAELLYVPFAVLKVREGTVGSLYIYFLYNEPSHAKKQPDTKNSKKSSTAFPTYVCHTSVGIAVKIALELFVLGWC